MTAGPWKGDWRRRIYERLAEHGLARVTDLAGRRPTVTFLDLAECLGPDVAAIQIETLLREEALAAGDFDGFARASLVRYVRARLPLGWGRGDDADFRSAHALASWAASLGECNATVVRAVWNRLQEPRIVWKGWLPAGPDDDVINRAFSGVTFEPPPPNRPA